MKIAAVYCKSVLLLLYSRSTHGDTWETGSLIPPSSLVAYTNGLYELCPPKHVGGTAKTLSRAIPTNRWWANLITCSDVPPPVWPNPYAVRIDTSASSFATNSTGISLTYPFRSRAYSDSYSNPGAVRFFLHSAEKELQFSAVEFDNQTIPPYFEVVDWSDAGATVQLRSDASPNGLMESDIVSGMAYFTVSYLLATPRLTLSTSIHKINEKIASPGSVWTDTRFYVETVNGHKWILYSICASSGAIDSSCVLTLAIGSNENTLIAKHQYNGQLRVAVVNDRAPVAVYDHYEDCIVTGGDVDVTSDSAYTFTWSTSGTCTNGLLQFAHPHQVGSIDTSASAQVTALLSMKLMSTTHGPMSAYVTRGRTKIWSLFEPSSIPITFYSKSRPSASAASAQSLYSRLVADISATWTIPIDGSYYSNGKLAQKYASLCLMANDPNVVGTDITPLRRCLMKLVNVITPMIANTWKYPIAYDTIYGGLISSQGIVLNNIDVDYGTTVYNDHHYHYGYWIYTAAVINYLYPTYNRLPELNRMIKLLIRDVATPNAADPYFPKYRNFDWFRGHSFSHGVTPLMDGKDQESTSEEINFAYAMYLYGGSIGDLRMEAVGKLLIKVNARALQSYFLMDSDNQVQPAQFIGNKVSGIFFENKLDYATWFSGEKYCIHGIQMIPITPITDYVRTTNFIREEWNSILSKLPIVTTPELTNPWLSLLYANYARVDKVTALKVLQNVALDDGLSRSWAIYMAAGQGQE
ncbi:unnamed protein product [Albugo candida]|uniref:glucan endo-1,3-beta-D-glucosidase n=1 Tax=Albugo candida TaxID=65357 RepID=A0A024G0T1_9STRA|nr:unnamed protein product [Albugo candida]|eukprot:CCI40275.1 unnamed protein product [Albugo candida]